MVGLPHRFNGHELGRTLGDGEGQGGLACCSPWGCKESRHDLLTEQHLYKVLKKIKEYLYDFEGRESSSTRCKIIFLMTKRMINTTISKFKLFIKRHHKQSQNICKNWKKIIATQRTKDWYSLLIVEKWARYIARQFTEKKI